MAQSVRRRRLGVHERRNRRWLHNEHPLRADGRWRFHRSQTHPVPGDDMLALQLHGANQFRIGPRKLVVAFSCSISVAEIVDAVGATNLLASDARVEGFDRAVCGHDRRIERVIAVVIFDTEHDTYGALLHGPSAIMPEGTPDSWVTQRVTGQI